MRRRMSSPPLLAHPSSAGQHGAAATLVRLCRPATTRASAPCSTRRAWRLAASRSKVPHSRLQSPFQTQRKSIYVIVYVTAVLGIVRLTRTSPGCAGILRLRHRSRSVLASSIPGSMFGRSLSVGSSFGNRLCNSNLLEAQHDKETHSDKGDAFTPCSRAIDAVAAHLSTSGGLPAVMADMLP